MLRAAKKMLSINLDFVMPDGKKLRQCSKAEIAVMDRFMNDKATFGDLNNAGPSTASLAFVMAREMILGLEKEKGAAIDGQ